MKICRYEGIYIQLRNFCFWNRGFEIYLSENIIFSIRFFNDTFVINKFVWKNNINCSRVEERYANDVICQRNSFILLNVLGLHAGSLRNHIFRICHVVYSVIDMRKLIFRGKLARQAVRNKRDDTANNLGIPCCKRERNYKHFIARINISKCILLQS